MTFQNFAKILQELESTASRLAMTQQLARLFESLRGEEIKRAIYLLQGRLLPAYETLEIGLSVKLVIKCLAKIRSDQSQVTKLYHQKGDLGLVALEILGNGKKTSVLSVTQVYEQLVKIAQQTGGGSQDQKLQLLAQLFSQLDGLSAKYVVRMVIGKLRLGFSTMTMIDALSWSVTGGKAESRYLEAAYQKRADVGELAVEYLKYRQLSSPNRQAQLTQLQVKLGVPVVPALCQRLNSAQEIIAKMGKVMVEPKYDGLRLQLHILPDHQLKAFTRNLDEVSHMFPELKTMAAQLHCQSAIIDGEVVGVDPHTQKLVEFQKTVTRKRKHDITQKAAELPIRFYVFDLLSLNGRSVIDKKLHERKELLKGLFKDNEYLKFTPFYITDQADEVQAFHEEQLALGFEGAVVKQLDSAYISGRKGWHWVKIKEKSGERGKLNDTLDCVVMGYYHGRGKRTVFGLGAILVGVLDASVADPQQYLTIAKIGTGLSDEQLQAVKKEFDKLAVKIQPSVYQVHKNLIPDVWVEPKIVLEIAADEVTRSPVHSAGVALRFPRLVKVRGDKNPADATTTRELKQIKVA